MRIIQSVDRALNILDLFDEYNTELKVTEISNKLMLNKSTVHSLLKTLQKHNYVKQNLENGKYSLGLKLFEKGNEVMNSLDIRTIAKRYLTKLSIETGHTIHLVMLDGKMGVYIDKVEGKSSTIVYSRIGKRVPIHSSGVGKVLLAFKSDNQLEEFFDDYTFTKITPNTITSKVLFLKELNKVKENGYAMDNEENDLGVTCFAVPIYDYNQSVSAAMSVSVPTPSIKEGESENIIKLLKKSALDISNQWGYKPNLLQMEI